MNDARYRVWLERGRAHQAQNLPLDAMLCFRQAIRAQDTASDPRFHLGEVLWQLGRLADALQAWREAAHADRAALAPRLALAEGSLVVGDAEEARRAADQVLELAPDDPRARFVRAIAAIARPGSPEAADAAWTDLAALIAQVPDLLRIDALAGALATVLGGAAAGVQTPLLHALQHAVADEARLHAISALLLAFVAEHGEMPAGEHAFWTGVVARTFVPRDHDAVRRLAFAAHRRGRTDAVSLAATYARLCRDAFRPRLPLRWPRRTSGALRVVVLAGPELEGAIANELMSLRDRKDVDLTVALLADPGHVPPAAPGSSRTIPLGAHPGEAGAKALATLDVDLLVDAVGLAAAVGPLLVHRSARSIVTLATVGLPWPDANARFASLADAIASTRAIDATGAPTAPAMAALFADAVRLHQQGERDAALAAYDRVLSVQPDAPSVLYLRGALQRDRQENEAALADFMAALASAPDYLDARIAAAKTALDLRRHDAVLALAQDRLEPSVAGAPLFGAAGLALLAMGDAERASRVLADAATLDMNDADAHYNHGLALQAQHDVAGAARAFQRALTLRPDFTAADFNLGVLFQQQGNRDAAIAAYSQVLRADPRHVQAYKYLGEVLFAAGQLDSWRANFDRFAAACPDAFALAVQALEVCQHFAQFDRIEQYLDGIRKERFAVANDEELVDVLEELLYLLLFFDVESELVYRLSLAYDAAAKRVHGVPEPPPAERRPGHMRVGYLSADLRDHVMGKMMWEVIARHDRGAFEVFLYALSSQEDAWTARYRGLGDPFVPLAALGDAAAAARIRDDDLDLLVDLSTHTRGARPGILARKPARVQITHVASAGALGLSAVDWKPPMRSPTCRRTRST